MTRIECKCRTCKINAAELGKTLPLMADVPPALLAACKGKTHGLVNMAHDPNVITGEAARRRTGVRAV